MIERWDSPCGRVTLYCADALALLPQLEAASMDFIFTDPPYGHNNNNNGDLIHRREAALGRVKEVSQDAARPIKNDGAEANEVFQAALPEFVRLLSHGGCCCCCCGGGGPDPQFARWSLWIDATPGLEFKQMVVWDKGPMGMGWHYRRSYETVLVATKVGAACKWYAATPTVENIIRPGDYGIAKIIPGADEHPTPKPIELPLHFIRLHTREGDTVLDPFMGRGSSIIAALRAGRRAIGIDIDPKWYEKAKARIQAELAQGRLFEKLPEPKQGSLLEVG